MNKKLSTNELKKELGKIFDFLIPLIEKLSSFKSYNGKVTEVPSRGSIYNVLQIKPGKDGETAIGVIRTEIYDSLKYPFETKKLGDCLYISVNPELIPRFMSFMPKNASDVKSTEGANGSKTGRAELSTELEELKMFLAKGRFEENEDYYSLKEEKDTWSDYRLCCITEENREEVIDHFTRYGLGELCNPTDYSTSNDDKSYDVIITLYEGFESPKDGIKKVLSDNETIISSPNNQKSTDMGRLKKFTLETEELKNMLKSVGLKIIKNHYKILPASPDGEVRIPFISQKDMEQFMTALDENKMAKSYSISERGGKPTRTLVVTLKVGFTNPLPPAEPSRKGPKAGIKVASTEKRKYLRKQAVSGSTTDTKSIIDLLDQAKSALKELKSGGLENPRKTALKVWEALGGNLTVDSLIVSLKKSKQPKMLEKEDFIELLTKVLSS